MNYYAFSALINLITNLILGGVVFLKNPRGAQNQLFALFCASVAFWSAFYIPWQMATDPEVALRMCRWLMFGAIWIPVFFFHYTCLLIRRSSRSGLLVLCYAIAAFLCVSDITTPWFVRTVAPRMGFALWPLPGPLLHVHIGMFAILLGYAIILLRKAVITSSGAAKNQFALSLVATLGGFGGGVANYFLWYNIPIRPVTTVSVSFYTVVIAYAILRHHFLDIRLVFRDTSIHLLTALLLAIGCLVLTIPVVAFNPYFAVTASVIVMAVLMAFAYNPIRNALQPAIDRFMFANKFAYLEELSQLPNDVLEFTSMREMLNFLVRRLTEAGRLTHAAVLMYDPAQQAYLTIIRYMHAKSPVDPVETQLDWTLPQNAALVELLESKNRLLTVTDLAQLPLSGGQALAELTGFEGAACFGVMRDEKLAGLVVLGKKINNESFNQRDIQILEALKLRIENFLLQALVTTEESLNMVKDSHDMKNDVNALRGRIPLRRFKIKNFERNMITQLAALSEAIVNNHLSPEKLTAHIESLKKEVVGLTQDQQQFLPIEEDALDRLRNKLQNWSEFGRLVSQSFKGTRHKEPVDVSATAKIAIERWTPAAQRKLLALNSKLGEGLVVHGERSLVEQIFDNLIDNAIKATDKGQVKVSCRKEDSRVVIEVADTGCGFPEEALKTILSKPFYQGEGRQALEKSTGIGLVLVNLYVKNLGGEIKVESKFGEGATFRVLLPVIETTQAAA